MDPILPHFSDALNVAVIGSSGGIGAAFVNHFSEAQQIKTIHACSRSHTDFKNDKICSHKLDLQDENSVAQVADEISQNGPLDIVLVASGFLHDDETQPEKSLRDISLENFEKAFSVNTFGPAIISKHFLPKLQKNRKSVFAALSARVGSITDNELGGWYAYRASKAALNMVLKTASIEVARRNKHAAVIGLHPGTVDTNLSKPFQSNIEGKKLFTSEQSAKFLISVIDDVTPSDTGKIFDWQGKEIPY